MRAHVCVKCLRACFTAIVSPWGMSKSVVEPHSTAVTHIQYRQTTYLSPNYPSGGEVVCCPLWAQALEAGRHGVWGVVVVEFIFSSWHSLVCTWHARADCTFAKCIHVHGRGCPGPLPVANSWRPRRSRIATWCISREGLMPGPRWRASLMQFLDDTPTTVSTTFRH